MDGTSAWIPAFAGMTKCGTAFGLRASARAEVLEGRAESRSEGVAKAAERIGLVWVDVQGHEAQFFAGARRALSSGVPVVSEFWPYGIRRAGFDAARFTAVAASLFSRFVHVETKTYRFRAHDIGAIESFFTAFPGPDDHQQVIFLRGRT